MEFNGAARTQLCAWVDEPGPDATLEFRNIAIPNPGSDQILVKMEASGVW